MIPEWEANTVYMTSLFDSEHPRLSKRIKDFLKKEGIPVRFIDGAADFWCRDFMPFQKDENKFVWFDYDPHYLKKCPEYRTDQSELVWDKFGEIKKIRVKLDGGALVHSRNYAIVSEDIVRYNSQSFNKLCKIISDELEVEVYSIPHIRYDRYGHADGVVRFIDENTVLISSYLYDDEKKMIERRLKSFNTVFLEVGNHHRAPWMYINYLRVGDVIVVPIIGSENNNDVMAEFERIFGGKKIHFVPLATVVKHGGALHCITWEIKTDPA